MDRQCLLALIEEKLSQDIPINEIREELLNQDCSEQEFEESLIQLSESLKSKLLKNS